MIRNRKGSDRNLSVIKNPKDVQQTERRPQCLRMVLSNERELQNALGTLGLLRAKLLVVLLLTALLAESSVLFPRWVLLHQVLSVPAFILCVRAYMRVLTLIAVLPSEAVTAPLCAYYSQRDVLKDQVPGMIKEAASKPVPLEVVERESSGCAGSCTEEKKP